MKINQKCIAMRSGTVIKFYKFSKNDELTSRKGVSWSFLFVFFPSFHFIPFQCWNFSDISFDFTYKCIYAIQVKFWNADELLFVAEKWYRNIHIIHSGSLYSFNSFFIFILTLFKSYYFRSTSDLTEMLRERSI